jgi:hypothetical protein
MAHPLPPGPHRALAGASPADCPALTDPGEAVAQVLGHEALAPAAGGRYAASPFAFVLYAAIHLAFVFGLLVLTRRQPAQVLQIDGVAASIHVAGFFGRNAIVIIGRRMISGPGNQ